MQIWILMAIFSVDMALCLWFLDSFLRRFYRVRLGYMVIYAAVVGSVGAMLVYWYEQLSVRLLICLGCLLLCGVVFEEAFRVKWPYMVLYVLLKGLLLGTVYIATGIGAKVQAGVQAEVWGQAGSFLLTASLALQALVIYYIRAFREKWKALPDKTMFLRMLIMPAVSIFALFLFLWRQFQRSRLDYEVSYFLLLFLISMNLLYYFLVEKMEILFAMQQKQKEYEAKNLSCREYYYEQLEKQQQEIRALRHDMKNQLIGILGELKSDDPYRAQAEIERILDRVRQTETIFYTGNPGVNAVLNFKAGEMERKHIVFDCQVDLPDQMKMDAKDIGLLVGSILDNAAEACERCIGRKHIRLKALYRNQTVILVCENSTNGPVTDLRTRKKDSLEHGIGIRSMKRLVKEYGGEVTFMPYEDSFRVEVMLYGMQAAIGSK